MGVRLALGATRAGVINLILREQLIPVGLGLIAGTAAAAWSAQFLKTLLFKMTPYDGSACWARWSSWQRSLSLRR
jgi:ABC-type antimicrobial peptide transport system permease subunit